MDERAEDCKILSPYHYASNNPVRFEDKDGKGSGDVIMGFALAVIDNVTGGRNSDNYSPSSPSAAKDFNSGQTSGNNASLVVATAMIGGGGAGVEGAMGLTFASGGLAIGAAAPVAALRIGTAVLGKNMLINTVRNMSNAQPQSNTEQKSNNNKEGGLPKGKGSVAPSERDPKRIYTKGEKSEMLQRQGGKCAGCKEPKTVNEVHGHHKTRHADGGKTELGNGEALCKDCHIKIHK